MITTKCVLPTALAIILSAGPASALSIKEYRKFDRERQAHFVSAAVSMTAYIHAANGETAKARCIIGWYFGTNDKSGPGPDQISAETVAAEHVDPERHIEGVILAVTKKACAAKLNSQALASSSGQNASQVRP